MSIQNYVKLIQNAEDVTSNLQIKYADNKLIAKELSELKLRLRDLAQYMNNLLTLKRDYSTNEIDQYITAINVHVDILKEELPKADYQLLERKIRIIRTIFKFHPKKWSWFTFALAWLMELSLFV